MNDSVSELHQTDVTEPALPFGASSRGSSRREMKAPSEEDKQENSSETGMLIKKQPGEDGTWDKRESDGDFVVTSRWGCSQRVELSSVIFIGYG